MRLRDKHPRRRPQDAFPQQEPDPIADRERIEVGLNNRYRRLAEGSAAGPDRFRNEYLIPIAYCYADNEARDALAAHKKTAGWFLNAELPDWVYAMMAETKMVALKKGQEDVRPLGLFWEAVWSARGHLGSFWNHRGPSWSA